MSSFPTLPGYGLRPLIRQQPQPVNLGQRQGYMPPMQAQPVNLGHAMPQMAVPQLRPVNLGQQGDMTGMSFSDPTNPNAPILDAHPQLFASAMQPTSKEKK